MKTVSHFLLPALAMIFLIGCATGQMNWDMKIGKLTYDQAVDQLGKPAQQKKLADGRTVAEWISPSPATPAIDDDFRYHSASFGPDNGSAYSHEGKLSLTFDTNKVLAGWSKD